MREGKQLDGLSHPTFSSYCQVETLNPLERQSKQLGSLMGSAIPPSRAIVEQGRAASREDPFGLCNPTLPEHRYYIIFSTTTIKKQPQKKTLPYPVFCGFCEDIVWLRAYSIFDIVQSFTINRDVITSIEKKKKKTHDVLTETTEYGVRESFFFVVVF